MIWCEILGLWPGRASFFVLCHFWVLYPVLLLCGQFVYWICVVDSLSSTPPLGHLWSRQRRLRIRCTLSNKRRLRKCSSSRFSIRRCELTWHNLHRCYDAFPSSVTPSQVSKYFGSREMLSWDCVPEKWTPCFVLVLVVLILIALLTCTLECIWVCLWAASILHHSGIFCLPHTFQLSNEESFRWLKQIKWG